MVTTHTDTLITSEQKLCEQFPHLGKENHKDNQYQLQGT